MTTVDAAPPPARQRVRYGHVLWMTCVVTSTAVLYGLTLLVPYFVNDLHRLPYDEWSLGQRDPKDLWPQGPAAGVTQLGAFLAMFLLLWVPWLGAAWAAWCAALAARQRRWGVTTVAVVTLALSVGLAAFSLTPLASALHTWRLD